VLAESAKRLESLVELALLHVPVLIVSSRSIRSAVCCPLTSAAILDRNNLNADNHGGNAGRGQHPPPRRGWASNDCNILERDGDNETQHDSELLAVAVGPYHVIHSLASPLQYIDQGFHPLT
jgi:hypothetical protein